MNIFKKIILGVGLLSIPFCGFGQTTYYVSTEGSNTNDGTVSSEWLDIEYASTQISGGDTVYIKQGTYDYASLANLNYSSKVVFATYQNDSVTFTRGLNAHYGIQIEYSSNIELRGLTAYHALYGFLIADSKNIRLYQCNVDSVGQEGIKIGSVYGGTFNGGCSYITIEECNITRSGMSNPQYGEGIYVGSGDLTYGQNDTTNNVTILNCEIYETQAEGIDLKRSNTQHDYIVDGNHVYNISPYVSAAISAFFDPTGNEYGNIIRNNIVHDIDSNNYLSNGTGIRLYDSCLVYNNLVYNCTYAGIFDDDYNETISQYGSKIFNNTCYNNGSFDIRHEKSSSQGWNNIGTTYGINSISALSSLFIDADNANFKLANTASTAIDAGINSIPITPLLDLDDSTRIVNGIIDIGAYEYQGVTLTNDTVYLDTFYINPTNTSYLSGYANVVNIEILNTPGYYDTIKAEFTTGYIQQGGATGDSYWSDTLGRVAFYMNNSDPVLAYISNIDTNYDYKVRTFSNRSRTYDLLGNMIVNTDTLEVNSSAYTGGSKNAYFNITDFESDSIKFEVYGTDSNGLGYLNSIEVIQYYVEYNPCDTTTIIAEAVIEDAPNGSVTLTLSGGLAPYVYLWSDGQTTNPAIDLSSNTYSVLVTDDNGCTFTDSYNIPYNIVDEFNPYIRLNVSSFIFMDNTLYIKIK